MKKRIIITILLFSTGVFFPESVRSEEIVRDQGSNPSPALNTAPAPSYRPKARDVRSTSNSYMLGAEDIIHITVFPDEDLSGDYTVGFDGKISINRVGTILASGKTTDEIENIIKEKLSRYVRKPDVSINIISFKSRKVLVIGQVANPAKYPIVGGARILSVLTRASWKEEKADLTRINVLRRSGAVIKVNLKNLLEKGDFSQNILLKPDDTIFVPELKEEEIPEVEGVEAVSELEREAGKKLSPDSFTVFVLGAVAGPGSVTYLESEILTVKQALTRAGWYTKNANLRKAKVIRANGIQEPIDLSRLIFQADMSQDLILYPEDTLYIPETKEIKIYVLGEVKNPGMYSAEGKMNVMQAIALADNSKFGAVLRNTKVVRGWPNKPVVYDVNLEKLLYKGDISQNMELNDGDVVYVPTGFLKNTLSVWTRLLGPVYNTAYTVDAVRRVIRDEGLSTSSSVVVGSPGL